VIFGAGCRSLYRWKARPASWCDEKASPWPAIAARRALIEAAWTYRYPARVSETLRARLEGLPKPARDIAWKAQVRLCVCYRRLDATGKKLPVVVARQAAIAREMAAFLEVSDGRSR
jgi:hypothetical protein